jgi:hydroxymethylbilane synthase
VSGAAADAGVVRIATRSSELALRQARLVEAALLALGVRAELVTYTTVGDRRLDQPLSSIGAKGLFTAELEADLLAGRVDCCVHSLKDLPTASPPGLAVVAQLEREDPRDALVPGPGTSATSLAELPPGARIGTSSLRRRAQLLALRPDLEVRELRGNVNTRLRKVDAGEVDAAILAAAGLHRLGFHERVAAYLGPPVWLPAAGQGAIAVQARADDRRLGPTLARLDHAATSRETAAERAFLAALEGGCQVPIGALAAHGRLHGLIASVDGGHVVRGDAVLDEEDAAAAGVRLADELRARGGDAILRELERAGPLPSPQPE